MALEGRLTVYSSEKKGLNNDIPFCPQGTFASYLSGLCPYFTMLHELQSFGAELNCGSEVENCTKFPPNTFIAYWAVVKEFLNDFNAFIIQIETEVKKQGMHCILNISAYIIYCPFLTKGCRVFLPYIMAVLYCGIAIVTAYSTLFLPLAAQWVNEYVWFLTKSNFSIQIFFWLVGVTDII
jgi:hypothetical protein